MPVSLFILAWNHSKYSKQDVSMDVSRKFQWSFKGDLRKFQIYVKKISRVFEVNYVIHNPVRMYQESRKMDHIRELMRMSNVRDHTHITSSR